MASRILWPMPMRLYDTAQREVVPLDLAHTAGMYVCGITPYDTTHLGHAATYLTYDLIIRRLESLGTRVTLVRNYTDVDDSILPKAAELGEHYLSLAEREMARFNNDMAALQTIAPTHEPRATQTIDRMIELIAQLAESGHTYIADGVTYFDVSTFPNFGKLSGLDQETMVELARKRGGSPDNPSLRNPLDFVLWQPSGEGEPAWDSPFGAGRPGWHIECSAMSSAALGQTIDIHGGGGDLIFPHHECEIAQSESLTGEPLARYWVHAGLVGYEGETMSKSLGNLVSVSDLRHTIDPRAIRLAIMKHHYRTDWEWFDEEAPNAMEDLKLLLASAEEATGTDRAVAPDGTAAMDATANKPAGLMAEVGAALDEDLDTPSAHKLLLETATAKPNTKRAGIGAELTAAARLCGIDLAEPLQTGPLATSQTAPSN